MARFSAKFRHSRRVVLSLTAAGVLAACGPEGAQSNVGADDVATMAVGSAEQHLSAHAEQSGGFLKGKAEFKRKGSFSDERGQVHTRFQQTHQGVKVFGGEEVTAGSILVRQLGTVIHPGSNVKLGRDFTLYSTVDGVVQYERLGRDRKKVSVYPPTAASANA